MSYTDPEYLFIFLPVVILLYNILPQKYRRFIILAASYLFFWLFSKQLVIWLIVTTVSMYCFGLWLSHLNDERNNALKECDKSEKKALKEVYKKKKRRVAVLAAVLHIGVLLVLKYSAFAGDALNRVLGMANLDARVSLMKFALPIGISFYTLMAVSYIVDVYREKIQADKNFLRVAMFISYFPHIVEGPFCRYEDTAADIYECRKTTYQNLTFGYQRMLYGLAKKMVIADRLNLAVLTVFDKKFDSLDGGLVALGMILYTCQLYMEFSGTMDIVIGTGQVFGVTIPENFRQPFFSKSVSEFWTRWHITLGTWFKDYIFYPLSLSKPLKNLTSKARKKIGNYYGPLLAGSIALFSVWFCNGLWHGAAFSYIFFGLYHFVMIMTGNLIEPLSKKLLPKLHIDRNGKIYTVFRIVRTTFLVFVGELFFRANGLRAGLTMFKTMVTDFTLKSFTDGTYRILRLDIQDYVIVGISVLLVFIVSLMKERGINIRESVAAKPIALRWVVYYALILFIVIFGAYGPGYMAVPSIYAGF
ncbi:MAG: MBOAT family O-acyltransferase [Lachnospiraceae bacterium]